MKDWKVVFRKDISDKISFSYKEFQMYKKTDYIIHLQQASEKIFSATENYLMLKYNKRVKSMYELRSLIDKNFNDRKLLTDAKQLHRFFYNADLQMSKEEAVDIYLDVRNKLIGRLKNE